MIARTSEDSGQTGEPDALVSAAVDRLLAEHPPATTPAPEFLAAQFDAGLAWVHFPAGRGGLGLPRRLAPVVTERLAQAGAPDGLMRNGIGYGMAAPTILAHGSPDQQRRYLRRLFVCEDIWCQLFSEPGAGSDVAGVATRAVRDGNSWIVNGQKVWTTLGHVAHRGLLLARTDPAASKHRGLTYFVVDMRSPGVEVRPLRQLTGDAEFNEIHLTDVRVPDTERLSEVGDGWRVALATLMNERTMIGGAVGARAAGPIALALDLWGRRPEHDPVSRDHLTRLWIDAEVHRLTALRAAGNARQGTPGPEGSIGKLAGAELNQRILDFCLTLAGPAGQLYGSYEMRTPDEMMSHTDDPRWWYLRSQANTIEGGTSEVMRTIIGERVLGLPGDVRVDKDKPWAELPRG